MDHIPQFTNVQNHINQELHGIYNIVDRNVIQQWGLGRLAIMFRKFLVPAINRRFRAKRYNEMASMYKEGYYMTLGGFLRNFNERY